VLRQLRPALARGRDRERHLDRHAAGAAAAHVKPIAKTDSCQAAHTGYIISGQMHIRMDDGTEQEIGPGDAFVCDPGHDAWIVGDEACLALDSTAPQYAKPA
jgi:hypothetical protein